MCRLMHVYTLSTACGLTELLFLSSAIQFIVEGLFVLFIITIAKSTPCSVRTRSLYTGNFFISFMIPRVHNSTKSIELQ